MSKSNGKSNGKRRQKPITIAQHVIVTRAWSHIREALLELEFLPGNALEDCESVRLNPLAISEACAALRQMSDDLSFIVADGALELHRRREDRMARQKVNARAA